MDVGKLGQYSTSSHGTLPGIAVAGGHDPRRAPNTASRPLASPAKLGYTNVCLSPTPYVAHNTGFWESMGAATVFPRAHFL